MTKITVPFRNTYHRQCYLIITYFYKYEYYVINNSNEYILLSQCVKRQPCFSCGQAQSGSSRCGIIKVRQNMRKELSSLPHTHFVEERWGQALQSEMNIYNRARNCCHSKPVLLMFFGSDVFPISFRYLALRIHQ